MKLPIDFDQFKQDPSKAISYLLLFVVCVLYWRSEGQAKSINIQCEKRLQRCEIQLQKMSKMLKTQDSICASLSSEIRLYRELGIIQ